MKMQMIPPILNDTGDCCCQNCPQCNNCGCVPGGDGCICKGDKSGNSIESAITCDLVWKEKQLNGKYKYYKVVSGSSQQNMPVVLPTASLTKRGVVQLTNELSDREDLALTPKGAKTIKTELDKEVADRVANDNALQGQLNQEKDNRANADTDLLNKINQEKDDRANADTDLLNKINQEITNRKTADNDLSNRITSAESKADSAVSKANNSVTGVTSNGDATVTVTKADGTSSNFTINNVAHATNADSATHATVADRLASGSEAGATTTYTFKKYVLTTNLVQCAVTSHLLLKEGIGNGNYHITYQYSFDVTFTFPKQIGNASDIRVDAINLVVTNTSVGGLDKLTSEDLIAFLNFEFGTSNKRTFTFYGPKLDTTNGGNVPTHGPVLVQGNIVVYVNDRTYVKVED